MRTLSHSEQMFLSEFLDRTPDHIYYKDVESRFVSVSASLARTFGCSRQEVVGKSDRDFFDAATAEVYREAELEILRTGKEVVNREIEHTWPDGSKTWSLHIAMPLHDEKGAIVGVWGSNKDITEAKLNALKLQEALVNLQAVTDRLMCEADAKSHCYAVIMHDLRNPFQAMLGSIELLNDTPLAPLQAEYVLTIEQSTKLVLALVNDLLDASKAEAGQLKLEAIEVDLPQLLEEVGRLIAVQVHAKNLEISVDIDPQAPERVMGDPTRLRQVLMNLAGNAAKFTEHGEVTIQVRVLPSAPNLKRLKFSVRDTGVGIPADRLRQMGAAYYQADTSTTRRFGGTGLGLYIARQIVDQMGGKISIESDEGVGSTFSFIATFTPIVRADAQGITHDSIVNGRALVVDDNATQRTVLVRQLAMQGIEAVSAASADEAMTLLRQARKLGRPFGVALLDYRMPGCDGLELARKITADPQLHATRLVLLTSIRHSKQTADSLAIAAQLPKPVSRRDLYDCLRLIWAGKPEDWHSQSLPTITQRELRAVRGRQHRHILVADDVPGGRKVVVRNLERLGYQATGVANGKEAVEAWRSGAFHLILMDCEMPVMDGFDATRDIRRQEIAGQRIPIVALTGRTTQNAGKECIAAGMDGFLIKPTDREGLEAALARHFGESLDATAEPAQLLTAALAQGESPIDLTLFHKKVVDGDMAFGAGLLIDFINQAETAIGAIAAAVNQRNTADLARIAHGLKTAAAAMEFKTIFIAVNRLESSARSGGEEVFTMFAPQVQHLLTRGIEQLRAEQGKSAA